MRKHFNFSRFIIFCILSLLPLLQATPSMEMVATEATAGTSPVIDGAPNVATGRRLETVAFDMLQPPLTVEGTLLFFLTIFVSAAVIQWVISKIPVYAPPVTVVWFLFGILLYGIAKAVPVDRRSLFINSILGMREMPNSVVYYVILPILLYEATQNINWFKFKRFLWGGISLAVIGVGMQVAILGIAFFYTFMRYEKQTPWEASFLLASTLASTDSVAVVSVLANTGAPDKLTILFDGESLINDGSSILLFQFFTYLLIGEVGHAEQIVLVILKLLFAGPLVGVISGYFVYVWITFFRDHYFSQCLATICCCYAGFFVADYYFSFSGPLTAVCYGLFINAYGHIALDREAQEKHIHLVEGLSLMANAAIFVLSGIFVFGMIESMVGSTRSIPWGSLLLSYLYVNVARALMIAILSPILRRTGYGINWKEGTLLVWGGLRGGIVLVLALQVEANLSISKELTTIVAFYIAVNVLLILLLNGSTFELLYRYLKPYPPKPFRKVYLERVMTMIDHLYAVERNSLESHWLFKGTNVLKYADKVVPQLGCRKLDHLGNLDMKAPNIGVQLYDLEGCDVSGWVVPTEDDLITELPDELDGAEFQDFNLYNTGGTRHAAVEPVKPKAQQVAFTEHRLQSKQAHSIAAVGQGISKPDVETLTGEPAFDPEFNLRLLERAMVNTGRGKSVSQYRINKEGQEDEQSEQVHDSDGLEFSRFESNVTIEIPTKQDPHFLKAIKENASRSYGKSRTSQIRSFFPSFRRNTQAASRGEEHTFPIPDISYQTKNEAGYYSVQAPETHKGLERVLRKEREGELYLMIFNCCEEMYRKLYHKGSIGGNSLLSLNKALALANEFAVEKVRLNPIRAWKEALNRESFGDITELEKEQQKKALHQYTGFEYEWSSLKKQLNCVHVRLTKRLPGKLARSIFLYPACVGDLEQVMAYVDVHEELLEKGGDSLENLLGKELLRNYKIQILLAKSFILILKELYPENFKAALVRVAAKLLLNIKTSIVKEQISRGLLLQEDKDKIVKALQQQRFKLSGYSQFFFFLRFTYLISLGYTKLIKYFMRQQKQQQSHPESTDYSRHTIDSVEGATDATNDSREGKDRSTQKKRVTYSESAV